MHIEYENGKLFKEDCLERMRSMDDNSIDCIITSPPYNKKGLQGKKIKIRSPEEVEASSVRALFKRLEESLSDEEFTEFLTEEQLRDMNYWLNDFESDDGGNCSPSFVKFTQGRLEEFDDIVAKIRESISTRYKYHRKGNSVWKGFEIDYDSYSDFMPEKEYHRWMVDVLNEMTRILKPDGSIFFNHKPRRYKNRAHLPTEFIHKSNANIYQLIVWDRKSYPNIRADILVPNTEHIYWLCKDKPKSDRKQIERQYFGEVWNITPKRQKGHPAPFPEELVKNCLLLSTKPGDIVFDPFMGSGTTALVAEKAGRRWIGCELDEKYISMTNERLTAANEINKTGE